jgi:hypothetical protein
MKYRQPLIALFRNDRGFACKIIFIRTEETVPVCHDIYIYIYIYNNRVVIVRDSGKTRVYIDTIIACNIYIYIMR